jgi:hypothetical protein
VQASRPQRQPADALRELAGALESGYRVNGMYLRACWKVGVLSVAPGVTVWSDGRRLW